jgi:hypothetical protein
MGRIKEQLIEDMIALERDEPTYFPTKQVREFSDMMLRDEYPDDWTDGFDDYYLFGGSADSIRAYLAGWLAARDEDTSGK